MSTTPPSSYRVPLLCLAVAACASLGTLLLDRGFSTRESDARAMPAAALPGDQGESLTRLCRELEELNSHLEKQPLVVDRSAAMTMRTSATEAPEAVRLEALLGKLEVVLQRATARSAAPAAEAALRAEGEAGREVDPEALAEFCGRFEGDLRAAEPSARPDRRATVELFGASQAEIYRRFGTPQHVGSQQNKVTWQYGFRLGDSSRMVVLWFTEGRLSEVSLGRS
ncbi:MAG: hypothetical protein JNM84_25015 [Planctomycetes bacterium]|nr:hypothetical protein [Planctomycetota bacterium]